jgi:hypothetical protein
MNYIDDVAAEALGQMFSFEKPILPSRLIGSVCTVRIVKGDSVVSYDTSINVIFYRIYHVHNRDLKPVTVGFTFFFEGGATGEVDLVFARGGKIDPSKVVVSFEKLPVSIYSRGEGNIILRQPA